MHNFVRTQQGAPTLQVVDPAQQPTVPITNFDQNSGFWRKPPLREQRFEKTGSSAVAPGTGFGDRYVIEELVGHGAFANVYRAVDIKVPGHTVALKLMHRPSSSRCAKSQALRELHHIASVFHPSLVQYKDHGWFEERLWFVMPWYQGETLSSRIKRAPLSRQEAQDIFTPLAHAVAAMHAAGIRHQDIKPSNIFLAELRGQGGTSSSDGSCSGVLPILLDLGVSTRNEDRLLAGTPAYFAPEVAARFAELESPPAMVPQTDVFSLALTLQNALEPEFAERFRREERNLFMRRRASGKIQSLTQTELSFLKPHFDRWLHWDPMSRPSAEEFAKELSVLTSPEEQRARRQSILRWVVPLSATSLMLLFAAVMVMHNQHRMRLTETEKARLVEAVLRASNQELSTDMQALHESYGYALEEKARLARSEAKLRNEISAYRNQIAQQSLYMKRAGDELSLFGERYRSMRRYVRSLRQQLLNAERRAEEIQKEKQSAEYAVYDLQDRLLFAESYFEHAPL